MAPSVKKPSAQAMKQQATAAANRSPESQPHKGKQNAPAPESTEQAPLPKRSPRKHVGSPGSMPVPRSSKRVRTQDTAETASEGGKHPYACVDGENIDEPDKEGDPTCRGLCHDFFFIQA